MKVQLSKEEKGLFPENVPTEWLNEEWAQRIHGQSLARLDERGGMSICEILANIERHNWHPVANAVAFNKIKQLQLQHRISKPEH